MTQEDIEIIIQKHRKAWNIPNGEYGDYLKTFAKEMYNKGIQDASDNADIEVRGGSDGYESFNTYGVDKESILKLKI